MAVAEFLNHFRAAALFVAPWDDDGSEPSLDQVAKLRRFAKLWFTEDAIYGFDAAGFYNLTQAQQTSVQAGVEDFRNLVRQLGDPAAADDEQIKAGGRAFLAVYRGVEKHVFDWEGRRAVKVLSEVLQEEWVPPFVISFDYKLGTDHTGDPAVWAWLIVSDEAVEDSRLFASLPLLRTTIEERLEAAAVSRRVYLSIRAIHEQEEWLAGVEE